MHKKFKGVWMVLLLPVVLSVFSTPVMATETASSETTQKTQLQNRIDFGNVHIMGQSIKSGSVYLLHRKKSDINSMLKIRSDFRKEIIEDYSLEGTELISKESEETKKN